MDNTIIVVIAVVVIWAVLFAVMMTFNKKRQEKSKAFENENRSKALVHLYGRNLKINGQDISTVLKGFSRPRQSAPRERISI